MKVPRIISDGTSVMTGKENEVAAKSKKLPVWKYAEHALYIPSFSIILYRCRRSYAVYHRFWNHYSSALGIFKKFAHTVKKLYQNNLKTCQKTKKRRWLSWWKELFEWGGLA